MLRTWRSTASACLHSQALHCISRLCGLACEVVTSNARLVEVELNDTDGSRALEQSAQKLKLAVVDC